MSSSPPTIGAFQSPPRWRADLALASVALAWGTTFVIVKGALNEISAIYFLATRFTLAALCMMTLFLPAYRRIGWHATLRGLRGGAIAGLLLWSGYVLQTFGLKYTSAGNSGFVTGLYIVLVPIISATIYRRVPGINEIIGILVAAAGMLLLTFPGVALGRGFAFNRGDVLTVACAVAFAFHLLALTYFSQREHFEAVALGQIVCAAILSWLALTFEPPRAVWSSRTILAILITAVFATALAFALQTWAQQYTTSARTALIFALEPVFALVTAIAIGGESLSVSRSLGCTLILTGILVVELNPYRRT